MKKKTAAKKKIVAKKIDKKKAKQRKGPKPGYAVQPYGKALGKMKGEASSRAGNTRTAGLQSGTISTHRIRPRIEFWKREEFYMTVGRVQNVTEMYVLNIINREWYYDSAEEGKEFEDQIKMMEDWEEQVVVTKFLGNMVRNWIVNGLHILSPKDWLPLQLQSIESKKRNKSGKTEFYFQRIDGQEVPIKADEFLEVPYIEFDREPWPVGMFDSLMNDDYLDIDGGDPNASLELYRQALQDNMKIHHKFASPRVIYTADGVAKEVIDNDVVPVLETLKPGDRAAFNVPLKIEQETVDGNARFIEHVNKIIDEIDTGLQSSANRLITEPSAMADAREAGFQDDDRILGIMEKIRVFMNKEVIPRVTGLRAGEIEFKWGAKDAFDLELPEPLQKAVELNIISREKALIILEQQYHWKVPSDDDVEEKFGIKPAQQPEPVNPDEIAQKAAEMAVEAVAARFESAPRSDLEKEQIESIKAENKLKNEKLVFMQKANETMESIRNEQ